MLTNIHSVSTEEIPQMFKRILSVVSASLVAIAGVQTLCAQQPAGRPTRVPVTLVLVDRLPVGDAPFLVQRRTDTSPHDVILLRADASQAQVSEAIRTLLVARQVAGDTATRAAILRVRPHQPGHANAHREFPWVPRVLADLRRAELTDVPGIGRVRAVQIWLPRQHVGRSAMR
ncbi:MAG TPA: hypothetical protein VF541_18030 [Longimicrobium sp.]